MEQLKRYSMYVDPIDKCGFKTIVEILKLYNLINKDEYYDDNTDILSFIIEKQHEYQTFYLDYEIENDKNILIFYANI